jgi:nitrogen regulatory protein PII
MDIVGLENQVPLASHEQSARKRGMVRVRRITVIANESLEEQLTKKFIDMGATGFTVMRCHGAGRAASATEIDGSGTRLDNQVRIETIVPVHVCENILTYLRREVISQGHVTAAVETVEAVVAEQFV